MSNPLDDYEVLVRQRRATRHFAGGPVDPALVDPPADRIASPRSSPAAADQRGTGRRPPN